MSQQADSELVRRLKAGEPPAFHELVERFGARLYGLAYSFLGNSADAEDVVQETLAGAYKSIVRFEGRAALWTWLARIAFKQAAKHRRAGATRRLRLFDPTAASGGSSADADPTGAPGEDVERGLDVRSAAAGSDARIDLAAALQALSPDHRDVIVLREMEQMSYEEIAEALDVPRGTVESRLHRARAELRKLLSQYAQDK